MLEPRAGQGWNDDEDLAALPFGAAANLVQERAAADGLIRDDEDTVGLVPGLGDGRGVGLGAA